MTSASHAASFVTAKRAAHAPVAPATRSPLQVNASLRMQSTVGHHRPPQHVQAARVGLTAKIALHFQVSRANAQLSAPKSARSSRCAGPQNVIIVRCQVSGCACWVAGEHQSRSAGAPGAPATSNPKPGIRDSREVGNARPQFAARPHPDPRVETFMELIGDRPIRRAQYLYVSGLNGPSAATLM